NVYIRSSKIVNIAEKIRKRIKAGIDESVPSAGYLENLNNDCQLSLIQNFVNFCFWAEKGKEKWEVEYPKGNIITGGWFGLEACFRRAMENNVPILSAEYLLDISFRDVKKLFESSNNVQIPLIKNRYENLVNEAQVLLNKYQGETINLLEESNFKRLDIIKNICRNFTSFNDAAKYKGKNVYFLKRAQFFVNNIELVFIKHGEQKIKDTKLLTAFADYKLPQILRQFGILVYSNELAEKIDNYVLIEKGSEDEIEIRASTIWVVEHIRQKMPEYSAGNIDFALWLLSQDQSNIDKPYHRTYTINY
ncbi:hypothetical protein A2Z67_05830, partial [Candidatus Woesebacteria bacterium RBG_13_36_22]